MIDPAESPLTMTREERAAWRKELIKERGDRERFLWRTIPTLRQSALPKKSARPRMAQALTEVRDELIHLRLNREAAWKSAASVATSQRRLESLQDEIDRLREVVRLASADLGTGADVSLVVKKLDFAVSPQAPWGLKAMQETSK